MEPKPPWYRRRKNYVALSLITATLAIVLLSAIFYLSHFSPPRNLTDFYCRPSSGGEAFIVNEEVDLTDGMNEDEALKVATCVLGEVNKRSLRQEITSSKTSSVVNEGIWNVAFYWKTMVQGYFPEAHPYGSMYMVVLHWYLEVLINPLTQMVAYTANEAGQ